MLLAALLLAVVLRRLPWPRRRRLVSHALPEPLPEDAESSTPSGGVDD